MCDHKKNTPHVHTKIIIIILFSLPRKCLFFMNGFLAYITLALILMTSFAICANALAFYVSVSRYIYVYCE